jgi:hypothetical protein
MERSTASAISMGLDGLHETDAEIFNLLQTPTANWPARFARNSYYELRPYMHGRQPHSSLVRHGSLRPPQ